MLFSQVAFALSWNPTRLFTSSPVYCTSATGTGSIWLNSAEDPQTLTMTDGQHIKLSLTRTNDDVGYHVLVHNEETGDVITESGNGDWSRIVEYMGIHCTS